MSRIREFENFIFNSLIPPIWDIMLCHELENFIFNSLIPPIRDIMLCHELENLRIFLIR